jgi:hypothetical protein
MNKLLLLLQSSYFYSTSIYLFMSWAHRNWIWSHRLCKLGNRGVLPGIALFLRVTGDNALCGNALDVPVWFCIDRWSTSCTVLNWLKKDWIEMSDTIDSLDLSTNAASDKQETFVKILKDNSILLSKSQIPSVKKGRHKQWWIWLPSTRDKLELKWQTNLKKIEQHEKRH